MTNAPTGASALPRRPLSPVVLVAIGAAWLMAIVAQVTGHAEILHYHHAMTMEDHHHAMTMQARPSIVAALALFVLAWQVMIAAMMLPSSLPLVRLFAAASADGPRSRAAMSAFLGGYALVWTGFGALAFLGDTAIHHTVDASPWLSAHSWLIGAGVLAMAGAFQFMPLKDRCLRQCRHPAAYLLPRYRRGIRPAFALGRGHGVFCVGCCWALMLVMFAAGVASLLWMAALTVLMTYEKTGRHGRQVVPVAGVVLLADAALVLAHPAWLPAALAGGI